MSLAALLALASISILLARPSASRMAVSARHSASIEAD
jgi:hypothetical protein